ncbi:hypothetical protein [Nocardiopsis sp. NPDC006938]|uniref:hypothetical protein n=1 Tax=Nocardiopsis sp. NPDC006938 TaxID=3364337 RepID=UPI0036AC7581
MSPLTLSPAVRWLAPATALAFLLSACGSDADGSSPAENEGDISGEEGTEETPDRPSITESGLFTSECDGNERVFTLYSADDGTEITSLRFSSERSSAATSEALGHGRAPEIEHLESDQNITGCGGQLISVSPHEHLLLRSYQEVVNGNTVDVFGVISEEGAVTTLSPEQEVSDFGTPVTYRDPIYDPVNERIVFVEYDTASDEGTVQAMDLRGGQVSDLGSCEGVNDCGQIAVLPESGTVVMGGLARSFSPEAESGAESAVVVESPNGERLLHANYTSGSTRLSFYSMEDALAENPDIVVGDFDAEYKLDLEVVGEPRFIDDDTLLLRSNELAVWEFTEELLAEHDYSEEGRDLINPNYVPVEEALVPEGPRRNESAFLSPDRSEILFYSAPQTGAGSWYRVPADGSAEPEEAFVLADPDVVIRTWQ